MFGSGYSFVPCKYSSYISLIYSSHVTLCPFVFTWTSQIIAVPANLVRLSRAKGYPFSLLRFSVLFPFTPPEASTGMFSPPGLAFEDAFSVC